MVVASDKSNVAGGNLDKLLFELQIGQDTRND